jgi:hypothetical protein
MRWEEGIRIDGHYDKAERWTFNNQQGQEMEMEGSGGGANKRSMTTNAKDRSDTSSLSNAIQV